MSKSYTLEQPDDLHRFPGEPLVKFYNRKLAAKGRHDVEWRQDHPGSDLYLVKVRQAQSKLDL
jgi:hypothetical protein